MTAEAVTRHTFTRGCRCRDCELKIVLAMEEHGSHFSRCIAVAWLHADSGNKVRLRGAFGHLLDEYEAFVE